MINKKVLIPFLFTSIIFVLFACGGSDNSDDSPDQAKFSLGISDAIIDEADTVFIEIDEITLAGPETTVISTLVAVDGSYSIGFVTESSYTLALMCGTDIDDNIQYNALTIPSPVGNITTVDIVKGDIKTIDS